MLKQTTQYVLVGVLLAGLTCQQEHRWRSTSRAGVLGINSSRHQMNHAQTTNDALGLSENPRRSRGDNGRRPEWGRFDCHKRAPAPPAS